MSLTVYKKCYYAKILAEVDLYTNILYNRILAVCFTVIKIQNNYVFRVVGKVLSMINMKPMVWEIICLCQGQSQVNIGALYFLRSVRMQFLDSRRSWCVFQRSAR